MAWPKGKPRGKRKIENQKVRIVARDNKVVAEFEDKIDRNAVMINKINEAKQILREPDGQIHISLGKITFVSIVNEKIISFKISE